MTLRNMFRWKLTKLAIGLASHKFLFCAASLTAFSKHNKRQEIRIVYPKKVNSSNLTLALPGAICCSSF